MKPETEDEAQKRRHTPRDTKVASKPPEASKIVKHIPCTTPATPRPWDFQSSECEAMNFCCLSHVAVTLYYSSLRKRYEGKDRRRLPSTQGLAVLTFPPSPDVHTGKTVREMPLASKF